MTVRLSMVSPEMSNSEDGSAMTIDSGDTFYDGNLGVEDSLEQQSSTGTKDNMRTRGSKVSNLRAAFEQSCSNGNTIRPFSSSSSDKKSSATNGRSASDDAELSRLQDLLAKEQELKDASHEKIKSMEAELERLRAHLREGGGSSPTGQQDELIRERDEALNQLRAAKNRVQSYEAESSNLRNQLADVKRSIATNTRIEGREMADSAIQEELGTLCYQIQDWVVNNFRKAKVDATASQLCSRVEDVNDGRYQRALETLFSNWESSAKLAFLQATVVTMIMSIFEDPLLFGLPSDTPWSKAVRVASEELRNVLDTTAYIRWRATTLDVVCHSEVMVPHVESASQQIAEKISRVLNRLCEVEESETRLAALKNVVKRVVTLSHGLRFQRAQYKVVLPPPGSQFDPTSMEDMTYGSEVSDECEVRCAVFPAVLKLGPGASPNIIFRAKVSTDTT